MRADSSASLLAARQALNAGHAGKARQILLEVVKDDPESFYGWLWLAGLSTSPRERLACLQRAQQIRPDDPALKKAWPWAQGRSADAPSAAASLPRSGSTGRDGWLVVSPGKSAVPRGRRRRPLWYALIALGLLLVAVGTFVSAGWIWRSWHREPQPSDTAVIARAGSPPGGATPIAQDKPDQPSEMALGQSAGLSLATETPESPWPTATQRLFRPKSILVISSGIRPTWTATPQPTNTPVPSPTPPPTFVSDLASAAARPLGLKPGERWIDVSLDRQYLIAYEGLTPVFETKVSSGMARFPTVAGQFRIYLRFEAQDMDGYRLGYDYYLKNVPFVQYFFEDYALHGTYWHNRFGTPMSHGCVNLPTPAAEWLFRWADYGTLVNIHS